MRFLFDFVCDVLVTPVGEALISGVECAGRGIDATVTCGIDVIGGSLDKVVETAATFVTPVGEALISGVECAGRGIDATVTCGIDVIGGSLDKVVETVVENPGKAITTVVAAVATTGLATVFAGPIAAAVGSTGALGAAGTGAKISSLHGVALVNASLASIGGGSLATGGHGMAAGKAVIAITGGTAGGAASAV